MIPRESRMPEDESLLVETKPSTSEQCCKLAKRKRTKSGEEQKKAKRGEKRKRALSEGHTDTDVVGVATLASKDGLLEARPDDRGDGNEKGRDEVGGKSKKKREKRRRMELSEQNGQIKIADSEASGDNVLNVQRVASTADGGVKTRKEKKKRRCNEKLINPESQVNVTDIDFATDSAATVGTVTAKPESKVNQFNSEKSLRGKEDIEFDDNNIKIRKDEEGVVGKKRKPGEKRRRMAPSPQNDEVDIVNNGALNGATISMQHIVSAEVNGEGTRRERKKRKQERRLEKMDSKGADIRGKTAMEFAPRDGATTANSNLEEDQPVVEGDKGRKQIKSEERVKQEKALEKDEHKQVNRSKNGKFEDDATKMCAKKFWTKLRKEGNRATAPSNHNQNKGLQGKANTGVKRIRAKQSDAKGDNDTEETKGDLVVKGRGVGNNEGDEDSVSPVEKNDVDKGSSGKEEDERLERTLFVGNVPLNATQKDIKKLFKPFGEIETVRIRGVTPENPRLPKKVALVTGRLAKFADSHHAYVVMKEDQDFKTVMKRAVRQLNMSVYMDHHIRVMPAGSQNRKAYRSSLFVGNLPFDCEEEELVQAFSKPADKLGVEIVNVRVNRDRGTGVGRGVGFVSFNDSLGVQGCMNEVGSIKIRGRAVRMEAASKEKKLNAKTFKRKSRATRTQGATAIYWQQTRANFRTKGK